LARGAEQVEGQASSTAMRPKSIATVVVALAAREGDVVGRFRGHGHQASVPAIGISLTAATNVVLPTPNAPAITIFADRARGPSEIVEATQHPLQQVAVQHVGSLRVDAHPAGRGEVADRRRDHAERQRQARGSSAIVRGYRHASYTAAVSGSIQARAADRTRPC